jgi:hypothetical protein
MTWIIWLGLAVIIVAVAAVTGIKPRGGRPVASTHLMGAARVVLVLVAVLLAWIAWRSYGGG